MTDKTDMTTVPSTFRSRHWAITANPGAHPEAIVKMQETGLMPDFVKVIYGGMEVGEEGTPHFQGHVETKEQVRFSQMKKAFPGSHIKPARCVPASIKYSMKSDTATGDKIKGLNADQNPLMMLGDIALQVAEHIVKHDDVDKLRLEIMEAEAEKGIKHPNRTAVFADKNEAVMHYYWKAVNAILLESDAQLQNPGKFVRTDVLTLWKNTYDTYLTRVQQGILNSITENSGVPPEVQDIVSALIIKNEEIQSQPQNPPGTPTSRSASPASEQSVPVSPD